MTCAIEFEDVRFSYDGEAPAIDGVDLAVAPGEFVCLLGGNGSGKSTLVRLINGLLQPDAGAVRVFGRNVADSEALLAVRAQVGMVFQNPDDQLVASVVENEVAFGPENLGLPAPEIRRRVSAALETVGLAGFESHHVMELSGGQKQRVAIAGALALEPRILVLDEACAMLDPMGRAGLMRVVRRLNDDGMTIVMITHSSDEMACATRCIELSQGRVVRTGVPGEFAAKAAEERAARGLAGIAAAEGHAGAVEAGAHACAGAVEAGEHACMGAVEADGRAHAGSAERNDAAPAGAVERKRIIEVDDISFAYGKPKSRRNAPSAAAPAADPAETLAFSESSAPSGAATPRWGGDPRDPWALRKVSFDVREGEVFGIAGHTGSGKSTLLMHLNGLLQPAEGRVLFDGSSLADKRLARKACGRVGIVFQYPEHQLFAPTVAQDVAFGPRNLGLADDEIARRVSSALARVGLPEALGSRSPFELSGGQQRRAALAGVIAMDPEVLVLDEPAAGLDDEGHRMLLRLIGEYRAEGRTVIIVSHNMDDLAVLCERVLVLNKGRAFALGAPGEVLRDARMLRAIGLDAPRSLGVTP